MSKINFNDKENVLNAIKEMANYITDKISVKPEVGIVLGSGLGKLVENIKNPVIISYNDIPHFPKATVEGHDGKLYIGELSGKIVIAMQGRNHYYEGYSTQEITLPIRAFKLIGVESLILTNACGAVSKHFEPGDLMIIDDHLSFLCPSPLIGAQIDELGGERFTAMSNAYYPEYKKLAKECADELNINIKKGVYGYWTGPTYETAAEINAFKVLGVDVVGMSTVAETMVATNAKMKVLGISCITNMTSIHSSGGEETSHEDVVKKGLEISDKFISLVSKIIEKM